MQSFAWIKQYINYKVWDDIAYPFQNINNLVIEVLEWVSNFISHFTGCVII